MEKYQRVGKIVEVLYVQSKAETDSPRWMWDNHVQFVAKKAEELCDRFGADKDLAVAGAWLHDIGDAFVLRDAPDHVTISKNETERVLKEAGYSGEVARKVIEEVIAPHSCHEGNLPKTLEGKVLATADALEHLSTDFYLQCAWRRWPFGTTYDEFIEWVSKKLDRDFHSKVLFNEVKREVEGRYLALKEVFKRA